ncbi:TonB-dependent receptor domain-containing protein [Zhouia sp. PK063]|uniref:TonB-dependent receptor n=1 Tax=Zhouia sp. PK063 TaxID=3373602 RepID=UPI0037944CD6
MKFLQITLFFLLIFSCKITIAQTNNLATISGKIIADDGEVLSGVNILLKGTAKGTMTGVDGSFQLANIAPANYILQISYLGFQTQEKNIHLEASQNVQLKIILKEKAVEFEAVNVAAKSITTAIKEQSYTVASVSVKDLYNSTSDAKEVLNRVSGVRILEDGGLGSNLSFNLNGFSGDQVKFFLDGIPMDHFGSSLSLSNIPVNAIDRIDVYKGVVPVWLGTDALGGAVNIITNQQRNFLDASYAIGSFNTHRASVNGAYTNKETGFTFRGTANVNYSDNDYKVWVPIKEGNNIVDTANVRRFHDRYKSASVRLETGVLDKPYADQLLFSVLASANDKQVQNGATMNTVYGGITRNSKSIIPTFKYTKKDIFTSGLDVSVNSAYNISKSEIIDTLRGITYNWRGDTTYVPNSNNGELSRTFTTMNDDEFSTRVNAGYDISDVHALAFNYSISYFTRETFDTENPDRIENQFPKSLTKQVAGLSYKFDPNSKWSTTVFGKLYTITAKGSKQYDFGLETQRTDSFKETQHSSGYGIASSYFILPKLQVKASYEHTYRMPTAEEIFGDGLFTQSNPDLGPEQSDNFNLGANYDFHIHKKHQFTLGSSFIYRNAKDLIYQVVKVASPQTHYENLSETRTIGVEGNVNYKFANLFHVGGNVTFQDITDQADFIYNESYTNTGYQKNYQKGYRLPNTPYFFGNATAGFSFKNVWQKASVLQINYHYNYVKQYFLSWAELGSKDSKKVIPTQSSHDLEFSYSLKNGKYNIALECRNLTDERLYDKYYLQKPGRAFYVKFRFVL